MQVREFVATTLEQIVRGVMDAQERTEDTRATVSPSMAGENWEAISFDMVVTVTNVSGSDAKITVGVPFVSAAAGGGSKAAAGSESRISFKVPVVLPTLREKAQ